MNKKFWAFIVGAVSGGAVLLAFPVTDSRSGLVAIPVGIIVFTIIFRLIE